jgi:hypothetical protein
LTPAGRRTPPDFAPVPDDDDLEGPASDVRPVVPLSAVPVVAVRLGQLVKLPLDPRAGYVLSLVDGRCDVETIVDICATEMERPEALDVLGKLLHLGVIALRGPR